MLAQHTGIDTVPTVPVQTAAESGQTSLAWAGRVADGVAHIVAADAPDVFKAQAQQLTTADVILLARAGQALLNTRRVDVVLMQRCWELAAYAGEALRALSQGNRLAHASRRARFGRSLVRLVAVK